MLKSDQNKFFSIDSLVAFRIDHGHDQDLSENDYLNMGNSALELGYPSLAYDIFKQGMLQYPHNLAIKYSGALALARSGSITTANSLVSELLPLIHDKDSFYADAMSLAGRLAKDYWSKSNDIKHRQEYARKSMDYYKKAFVLTGETYPGINAATMSLFCGKKQQACDIATQVHELCQQQISSGVETDHWLHATLGEAELILGRYDAAQDCYRKAVQIAGNRFGDIASMRRQIRFLSEYQTRSGKILEFLHVPVVLAFSGHMIDNEERTDIRFPAEIEPLVRQSIRNRLEELEMIIGYSSAACGADLIFLEEMQKQKHETHIILPFKRTDFIKSSLEIAGSDWVERFETVSKSATSLTYATQESYLGDDVLFTYTNRLICGKAILKAQELESKAVLLTVIDQSTYSASGGTLENLKTWSNTGNQSIQIDLGLLRKNLSRSVSHESQLSAGIQHIPDNQSGKLQSLKTGRQIRTMLFADCVGFSKLQEEDTPSFFVNFLGHIAGILNQTVHSPVFANTWGDGLFLVFEEVDHAAEFALCLREMVITTDWKQFGLPADTGIRIGMHTGPVYCAEDPIIRKRNYFGTHVNIAARIEPVVTPGSIYLTEQSASILAISTNRNFTCDYLGMTELAKKYGSGPLYRLRRASTPE